MRTLDEFFERLIVVDRKVAFIPAPDNDDDAVIIKDEAVVRYLADVFDRSWQRATEFPFGSDGSDATTAKAWERRPCSSSASGSRSPGCTAWVVLPVRTNRRLDRMTITLPSARVAQPMLDDHRQVVSRRRHEEQGWNGQK